MNFLEKDNLQTLCKTLSLKTSDIGEEHKCCALNDLVTYSEYTPCAHCVFHEGLDYGGIGDTMCNCYANKRLV